MEMKEKIIDLFKQYGFEYRKQASNGDYLAFTFNSAFFHNVELVSLQINDKEQLKKKWISLFKSLRTWFFDEEIIL